MEEVVNGRSSPLFYGGREGLGLGEALHEFLRGELRVSKGL